MVQDRYLETEYEPTGKLASYWMNHIGVDTGRHSVEWVIIPSAAVTRGSWIYLCLTYTWQMISDAEGNGSAMTLNEADLHL